MLTHPLPGGAELAPLEPWQAAEFLAHVDAERAHLEPWLPLTAAVTDEESARALLTYFADQQASDRARLFGIRAGGELAGGVMFRTFDAAAGTCELGVWVGAGLQGRGIVTAVCGVLVDWAIHARGLRRVEWHCDAANARSSAVARRLGFTREGVLRQGYVVQDRPVDVEVWAVLDAGWTGREDDGAMLTRPLPGGTELAPLEPWQAAEFLAHVDGERARVSPWMPFVSLVHNEEAARAYLQRYADDQARGGGRLLAIRRDGRLVGGVLYRCFDAAAGTCEVGVWVAAGEEGHGLAAAAVRVLIDWAVRVRGVRRVEWRCDPANTRSSATARRLGFTRDGVLRQAYVVADRPGDVEVWSLLAADRPPSGPHAT